MAKKAANRSSATAEIKISVTQFKDVFAGDSCGTDYRMKMISKNPRVFIDGDVIYVKPPAVTIRFTIASSPGDKERYFPIGITFVRQSEHNTSDEQRLGLLNFPQRKTRVLEQFISITDSYRDKEKGSRYKFSVVIQRGSDGKIGIIDPGIAHDNSGFH